MGYEFSLGHLTALECPPPELVRIAGDCGYEFASLRPVFFGLPGEANYELAKNARMLKDTKQAVSYTGVKIHDIELFRIAADRDVRDYEPALAVGAELGAKNLISSIWDDDLNRAADQFALLVELAFKYEINVNLEFPSWSSVWDMQGALAILKAQSRKNVGLLVDTLHFSRSRIALEELDSVPASYINFIHLCDAPGQIPDRSNKEALIHTGRDARLYIGEGGIDIAAILNRLPAVVCSIELPNLERVKEYGAKEHARRCLASAKEYFASKNVRGK
ncbi:MAG: sugar phosphate isomerase/epimerase [Spirochaetes bacterium]|nr:sugar phosphate isomerase/epimerase [Spirochaetota bacterium]